MPACASIFSGGEGGIRTRGRGSSPDTHLAGEPIRPLWHLPMEGVSAEGVGFEPTVPLQVRRFSRPLPSTARSSLQAKQFYHKLGVPLTVPSRPNY